jgi:hypothetical protein
MGGKIRSINMALEHRRVELLNLWKDCSSSKDKICNVLAHLVKTEIKRMVL